MNNPDNLNVPMMVPSQTSDLHILSPSSSLQSYHKNKNKEIVNNSPLSPETPLTPQPMDYTTTNSYKPDNIQSSKNHLDVNNSYVNEYIYDDEFKRTESIQSNASSNWSFTDLLGKMAVMEEQSIFIENGYKKLNILCDTLQGQLFKAQRISDSKLVVIKKTNKELHSAGEAIQDEMTYCVAENIVKEALILKYLTIDNTCIGDYIINYIDWFTNESDYFLVMEYIESEMNLKQFIEISHGYIKQGKLKLKSYQKIIKYLYWQLAVTIHWLHCDMNCVHLDLVAENIMLKNCTFQKKDNMYVISNNISIKLGDFGVSEVFKTKDFTCTKSGVSLDNESYLAPKVYNNQLYLAHMADTWSCGMILFECMRGKPLYDPEEILFDSDAKTINGYVALYRGEKQLRKYLKVTKLSKYFTTDAFNLLINLLELDDTKRFNANNILRHKWFKLYFKNYAKRIEKKSKSQLVKSLKQKAKMINFPYYQLKLNSK